MSDGSDFLVSAALLRRTGDTSSLVGDLSTRLTRALPGRVEVRKANRLSGARMRSVAVDLAPDRFRIEIERQGPVAWIDQVVRGVCIRSVEVTLDEWLERLAVALSNEARKNVECRLAIEEALQ